MSAFEFRAPTARKVTDRHRRWLAAIGVLACLGLGFLALSRIYGGAFYFFGWPGGGTRGVELAAPLPAFPQTRTLSSRAPAEQAFRIRHYLDAYRDDRTRDGPLDPRGEEYLSLWVEVFFGVPTSEQYDRFLKLGALLLADIDGHDAVLVHALSNDLAAPDQVARRRLLQIASDRYAKSRHHPYPRFCIAATLAVEQPENSARIPELDNEALSQLRRAVRDGSLPPDDQEIIADNLVYVRWGARLFKRRGAELEQLFREAGPQWEWLTAILEGENHRRAAWDARGQGFAHTVTNDGRQRFQEGLRRATKPFTRAWELEPTRPIAAARMVSVSMGQVDAIALRMWFERALSAQIDHPQAWRAYRQALTRRWLGSTGALLALGKTAVATDRFDTETPAQLRLVLDELAKEAGLERGATFYGRPEIWPLLNQTYATYADSDRPAPERARWIGDHARIAYFSGHYEIARKQLHAAGGRLPPPRPWDWDGHDLSNMEDRIREAGE